MPDSDEELYASLWGESPPQAAAADDHAAGVDDRNDGPQEAEYEGEVEWEEDVSPPEPASNPAAPAPLITSVFEGWPQPEPPPVTPNSVLLQHQTLEALRRLEARVGALQHQLEPLTGSKLIESLAAMRALSGTLTRAVAELDGTIDYSRRMVQELADIQAEARRGLAVIHERLRELEIPRPRIVPKGSLRGKGEAS